MPLAKQSISIVGAFLAVFIWQTIAPTGLTTPAIAILVLTYLVLIRRGNKSGSADKSTGKMDSLSLSILIALILLLIIVTGSINSPLYFLLYFVPFAITFVLLPKTTFIFLIGSILLFLSSALEANVGENLIKLGSLVLITPLAYFFGKEYQLVEEHAKADKEIATTISQDAANVLRDGGQTLGNEEKKELADIIDQTEELKNN